MTPIDLVTGKVLPAIHLGPSAGPAGIAITPNGKMAYVTDAGAIGTLGDTITPIDLATDRTLAPITVGPGPQGIAITPDGQRPTSPTPARSCPARPAPIGSTVTPVDLTTGKALRADHGRQRAHRHRHHARRFDALVTNLNSGSVSPIDIASDTAGAPIAGAGSPDRGRDLRRRNPRSPYVVDAISKQSQDAGT